MICDERLSCLSACSSPKGIFSRGVDTNETTNQRGGPSRAAGLLTTRSRSRGRRRAAPNHQSNARGSKEAEKETHYKKNNKTQSMNKSIVLSLLIPISRFRSFSFFVHGPRFHSVRVPSTGRKGSTLCRSRWRGRARHFRFFVRNFSVYFGSLAEQPTETVPFFVENPPKSIWQPSLTRDTTAIPPWTSIHIDVRHLRY